MGTASSRLAGIILIHCFLFHAPSPAQLYDYSFRPEQKRFFTGRSLSGSSSPQAVARKLLDSAWHPETFNSAQMGMRIRSVTASTSRKCSVTLSSGTKFIFQGARLQHEMGTIECSTALGANRSVATLRIPFSHIRPKFRSPGSVILEALDAKGKAVLTMRLMADGLLMMQNRGSIDLAIDCTLHFFPGYVGVDEPDNAVEKTGYNCLFLDNYGGIGFYLLGIPAVYSTDGALPRCEVIVRSGSVLWTAVCPPRPYDWQLSFQRPYLYYGADTTDNRPEMQHREQQVADIREKRYSAARARILDPYPNWSTFKDWADRKTWIRGTSPFDYSDILVSFPEVLLYENWNLGYKPRHFVIDGQVHNRSGELLVQLIANAHSFSKKILLYTSPYGFFKDSPYEARGDSLYASSMSRRYGSNAITEPAGNPRGENMESYLQAVSSLLAFKNGSRTIDGIYMDGLYALNIPQSYVLMRRIRHLFGDRRIIFLHATPRPGNDGYLPQIDTYASFGMFGEGGVHEGKASENYFRYFQGTYNISNTVGIVMRDYFAWQFKYPRYIVDLADSVNLRLMAFPAYTKNLPGTDLIKSLLPSWRTSKKTLMRNFAEYARAGNRRYRQAYLTQSEKGTAGTARKANALLKTLVPAEPEVRP